VQVSRAVSLLVIGLMSLVVVPSAQALRPYLSTEDAVPIGRGLSRIEIGFIHERFSNQKHGYGITGELTHGLINNMDFEVEVPYLFLNRDDADNENGIGDIKLKSRVRFIRGREANPLSIAGQFIVKLPFCDEDKRLSMECKGEADVGGLAIASKEFFPVTVHLNLGFIIVGNPPGGELDDVFKYSLAFDVQTLYEPVRFVSELAGETQRDPDADSDLLAVLAGLIYSIGVENFLDFAISLGLTEETPDYALTLGYSHHF
jgi:hypothetical protein